MSTLALFRLVTHFMKGLYRWSFMVLLVVRKSDNWKWLHRFRKQLWLVKSHVCTLLFALQYVLAWFHKTLINMSFNFHQAKALSGYIFNFLDFLAATCKMLDNIFDTIIPNYSFDLPYFSYHLRLFWHRVFIFWQNYLHIYKRHAMIPWPQKCTDQDYINRNYCCRRFIGFTITEKVESTY